MREWREELTLHVGGKPTATQKMLIERACRLHLRLTLLDRDTLTEAGMSEKHAREYCAWANALTRILAALGPPASGAPPAPTLNRYLAERSAA